MWTKRERAMLKAIGKEYFTELKNMRDYKANSKERGDTNDLNREVSRIICVGLVYAIRAAASVAYEVKEPDYKAMWEGLKKDLGLSSIGYKRDLLYFMAEIERRHGGKA